MIYVHILYIDIDIDIDIGIYTPYTNINNVA